MRNLLILVHIALLLVRLISGRTISLSSHCNLDSDHTKLGRCLRPWLDLWEMIRIQEPHASNLLFPIPFYSRESVLFLCSAYINTASACLASEVLQKCRHNEMIIFVLSHMRYYCGNRAKIAFGEFDCLRGVLMAEQRCWQYIEGIPSPTHQTGKCRGMPKFFDCVLPTVRSRCQNSSVYILVDAILSFGCPLGNELVQESAKFFAKMNSTGELTDEAGKKYIQKELPAALPVLDDEKSGKKVTYLYDLLPSVTRGPGMIVVGERSSSSSSSDSPLLPLSSLSKNITKSKRLVQRYITLRNTSTSSSAGPEATVRSGQSSEIASTDDLRSSYNLNQKKPNVDYRRAPTRKVDRSLDYEHNTFLESDPTVEIAFDGDGTNLKVNARKKASTKCTKRQEAQITRCYAPLLKLWDQIQSRHRPLDDILLPFLNYEPEELGNLCDAQDIVLDNCLTKAVIDDCQDNELMEFVDEHFGVICTETRTHKLSESFTCLRNVFFEKQECADIIRQNGAGEAVRCDQMSNFFNCLMRAVERKCSSTTKSFFVDVISNFGCAAHLNRFRSNLKTLVVEESELRQLQRTAGVEGIGVSSTIQPGVQSVNVLDGEQFSYELSKECSREMRIKARKCVRPLMLTWKDIRQQRPILKTISFPMYKYTRTELLELCDDYANVFLCTGFEPIVKCLNDEMVRFARDHLGYICTPQNIERFMKHYDCIMELAAANDKKCGMYIMGIAKPGKDLWKCRGVLQYYDCMKPGIVQKCRGGALKEFEESINEYGCTLGEDSSKHLS